MEVKIGNKTYEVKELLYKDVVKLSGTQEEVAKKMMLFSTGMTEEDFDKLSLKEGIELQKVINDLNGLAENFQKVQ